jgi:pimeloyl-ACP methyl ester carboxylesterase
VTPPNVVPSTDGVLLAVHDLGGRGQTLLLSHATGFHGRAYRPIADALADRFHSVALDYRGHGDTPQPERPIDWERYGDDAVAASRALVGASGGPIVAFGHSMGGACLLMAAHRDRTLFSRLVLFEPIVFPAEGVRPPGEGSPLVEGARRRRSTFASYDAAIANFSSKPPLNAFTPAALEAYVRDGFAEAPDGSVHLKCRPEIESGTFELGGKHDTWSVLESIEVPVVVAAGRVEESQPPSLVAEEVAARLPHGRFLRLAALDHFAPMTAPDVIADVIAAS